MKKATIIIFVAMLLAASFPFSAFAATNYYTPGLLQGTGAAYRVNITNQNVADGVNVLTKTFTTNVPEAVDNNDATTVTLNDSAPAVVMILPNNSEGSVYNITGFYFSGSGPRRVIFYDGSGNQLTYVGSATGESFNGYYNFSLANVKYIVVKKGSASGSRGLWDFEVYGSVVDIVPPPAPAWVTATPGDANVSLNWQPVYVGANDLRGYNIYRNGVKITGSPINTTTFTDNGLLNGTQYSYQISSVDLTNNESARSNVVYATPQDLTPPAPPTGLSAIAGDQSVQLSWNPNTEGDLRGYNVYMGATKLTSSPITSRSYSISSGLINGVAYTFHVTAVDYAGNESAQTSAMATPADMTAPAVPTGLGGNGLETAAQLHWNANTESDLKGYYVYRGGIRITPTPITGTSYTASGLTAGTEYSFQVSAVDLVGNESAKSAAVNIIPLPDTTPPDVPTGLIGTAGYELASLNWDDNEEPDLQGYHVYRDGVRITSSPITSAAYTDTGRTIGVAYGYQVSAVDQTGNESGKTSIVYVTPVADTTPPGQPTGLLGLAGDRSVELFWDPNPESDVQGYHVYQDGVRITSTPVNATDYMATGLQNMTVYSFQVTAVDASGNESIKSLPYAATPFDNVPPMQPIGLTGTPGDGAVTLHWDANPESDVQGYHVYQDGEKLTSSPISGTSYTIASGLLNGTAYSFEITAVDTSLNESIKSTAVSITPVDLTPPAAPSGLAGSGGYEQASISWSANTESDLQGYYVYRDGIRITATPISDTSYVENGLTNGQPYSYRVSAIDIVGNESAKSIAVSVTPQAVAKPTGLKARTKVQEDESMQVQLTWNPLPPPVVSYKIYRGATEIGTSATPGFLDSGVTAGQRYVYYVSAVDDASRESDKSEVRTYVSGQAIDYGESGFDVNTFLRTAAKFVYLFVGFIALVLAVIFAPQLYRFLLRIIGRADKITPGGGGVSEGSMRITPKSPKDKQALEKVYGGGKKRRKKKPKGVYG